MRHLLIITFCLCMGVVASSAQSLSFPEHAKQPPGNVSGNLQSLTDYLCAPDTTDWGKASAIYTWITHNVKYDIKAFESRDIEYQSPAETLKEKKGVCTQYSELFVEMCRLAGLKAFVVNGYAKGMGYRKGELFLRANHAWNAVFLNGRWVLLDATWGSGYVWYFDVNDEKKVKKAMKKKNPYQKLKFFPYPDKDYFNTPPEKFVEKHFPWVPRYQLLPDPIEIDEFLRDSTLSLSTDTLLNFPQQLSSDLKSKSSVVEYHMGYKSLNYHPRNNFDRAAAIVMLETDRYSDGRINKSMKSKYESLAERFATAEELLEKHKEEVRTRHSLRKQEISTFLKLGNTSLRAIRNDKPASSGTAEARADLKNKLAASQESKLRLDAKIDNYKQDLKEEGLEAGEHLLEIFIEWNPLEEAKTEYDRLTSRFSELHDSILVKKADINFLSQIARAHMILNQEYDLTRNEHKMVALCEEIKAMREEMKGIRPLLGEQEKAIEESCKLLGEKASEKLGRAKKMLGIITSDEFEIRKYRRHYSEAVSDMIGICEIQQDVIDKKQGYIQLRMTQLETNDQLYKAMLEEAEKFEARLVQYHALQSSNEESQYEAEKEYTKKWKSYATQEKRRIERYLKRIERLD